MKQQQQQCQTAACKAYKTGRERRSYGVLRYGAGDAPSTSDNDYHFHESLASTAHAYNATWGDPLVNSVIIMQRVLLLGSGRTCPPLVELLTRDRCVQVTIGKA